MALLLTGLAGLLGAAAAAAWVRRSLDRRLASLSEAADRIARGELEVRVQLPPGGELGRLADVMNSLSRRVSGMIGELSAEKAELKAILANMVEGVAAVDPETKVLELNPAMERLFGVDGERSRGRPFLEALRHRPLEELLAASLSSRSPRSSELTLFTPEERVFEVHANPIVDGARLAGAVLVLHDISRLRRLEEVRKEFVANVSHELRTPLASIKGFAETLRRGALDDVEHRLDFVEAIEKDADRLTRLVDDLLDLSAVESGSRPPRLEPIELGPFLKEVAEGLGPLAQARRVTFDLAVPYGLRVSADRTQLRQIFLNLLDNAVKYNREGGVVEVTARSEGPDVSLAVVDKGPGIPAADLPRIFERFYRVDKGRSRELGGTGLGLSIVKHLVEAHGGRVWAESVEGAGSTFRFTLPLAP